MDRTEGDRIVSDQRIDTRTNLGQGYAASRWVPPVAFPLSSANTLVTLNTQTRTSEMENRT